MTSKNSLSTIFRVCLKYSILIQPAERRGKQDYIVLVILAKGVHLIPSRTQQLSPSAPMIFAFGGESRSSPRQCNLVFLLTKDIFCGSIKVIVL